MGFFHGVETVNISSGPRVVTELRSSVVALIGTAPSGPVNQLTVCQNSGDDAQFGVDHPAYTIPAALKTLRDYKAGTVLVVNVLDDSTLTSETRSLAVEYMAGGALIGGFDFRLAADLSVNGVPLDTTDYLLTPTGKIRLRSPLSGNPATVQVGWRWRDPEAMPLAAVLGSVSAHGVRSGLKLVALAYSLYGFEPKTLIAPGFASHPAVDAALQALAEQLQAVAYVDVPLGLTRDEALACRGAQPPLGLTLYSGSSQRARLCYPFVQQVDDLGQRRLVPSSLHWAGVRVKTDAGTADPGRPTGWWSSSSNKALAGVVGLEWPLTARVNDPDSDVNLLGAGGLSTVFRDWGTGFRSWGNRSTAYPADTSPENFEQVRRSRDMIEQSIEMGSLQFVDADIDQAQADGLTEFVNGFLRSLKGRGAIFGGECWFDPARTAPAEFANGQIRVQYKFTPKLPSERITYESELSFEYLLTLKRTTGLGIDGGNG